ncbi:hypothetical protein U1Q18_024074 [Sarracenia purpurea var. burkii]
MNQVNQGNDENPQPSMPVKRKRGRPRKDQSLNHGKDAPVPPGFGGVKVKRTRQIMHFEDANPSTVGQAVTGVVEAAFDAGYLLNVKIGNSNTILRGVVFKPGHFVPISAENDVAPHVRTISRNEFPLFPMENQTRVLGRHPRSRVRKQKHDNLCRIETGHSLNGFPPANQGHIRAPQTADLATSTGKHVAPVSAYPVPSVGSRGTVVPVVLVPVSMPNGFLPCNQMPAVPSGAAKQPTHQVSAEVLQNGLPPNEVHGRVQISSQSSETRIMAASKSSAEDSGLSLEGDGDYMNEPVSVEPLQAIIHSDIPNQSRPDIKPFENCRIGRMSELLQALQENMVEKQLSRVGKTAMEADKRDDEDSV